MSDQVGDIFAGYVSDLGYDKVKDGKQCSRCRDIQDQMNQNGPKWCLEKITELTDAVAENYASRGTGQRLLAAFAKPYIRSLILSAISEVEKSNGSDPAQRY